jgi:hypothetical protein
MATTCHPYIIVAGAGGTAGVTGTEATYVTLALA